MRRWALALLIVCFVLVPGAFAQGDSNEGGNGGGYTQLPTCTSYYVGTTLYVQGHFWRCTLVGSRANPPYWTFVS